MRLNIFWRMIISYLIVVMFVIIIGSYTILKWNQLNKSLDSILNIDQPSIDKGKKMIDSLLSQVQNERKYIITGDEAFYRLFWSSQSEFTEYLDQLNRSLKTPEEEKLKNQIENLYSRYDYLLKKEISARQENKLSNESQHEEEKNRLVDGLTETLDKLIVLGQTKITSKMEYSKRMGAQAMLIIESVALVSLILGFFLAFSITRSINKPLKILEASTRNIAEGNFDTKITVQSPLELAQLAESFRRMADRLKEIDEMKSGFISHISHELRTPLTSMNEANSLLLDEVGGAITQKQKHLLEIIEQGNQKLIKLIDELLELSKMEAGMMDYQFSRASVLQIINQSIEDIKLLSDKKDIYVRFSADTHLPLILMDVDKIQRVINNLLSNAVKFTPEKGVVAVTANLYQNEGPKLTGKNESYLRVRVANTGSSIPPEYIDIIFDKFQQIETEMNSSEKGTGLGLSIAKHIVEAHDGKIWAEKAIENGSAFSFILPMGEDRKHSHPNRHANPR